jgi:hypothetical protein
MAQMCSECGDPVPPASGWRKWTCSSECAGKRAKRHATRPVFAQPPCSECGGQCPERNRYTVFLTCSEGCTKQRRNRLRLQREALKPRQPCVDCGGEPTGRGPHTPRCADCRRARQRVNAAASRARKKQARLEDPDEAARQASAKRYQHIKANYGLSREDYELLESEQEGLCAICQKSPVGRGKMNFLVVDHCHTAGHIRGLLCGNCNIAIGLFEDDPGILESAIAYLRTRATLVPEPAVQSFP